MRKLAHGRWPAPITIAAALIIAAASTAVGATTGPVSAGKRRPAAHRNGRWSCPRRCSTIVRRLADGEVRRLQAILDVGRADYASTANIANHVATADQASTADHASRADSAPIASVEYVVKSDSFDSTAGKSALSLTASCPGGLSLIGGGARLGDATDSSVVDSGPTSGNGGWTADAKETNGAAGDGTTFKVTVICGSAAATTTKTG